MITLKNREGTRVDLDITRDDASQIAPALARGWAFVEVVEQEITHEAPDAVEAPAPRARKARAPKAETTTEKAPRAPKADDGTIGKVFAELLTTGQKADAIYAAAGVDKKAGQKALKALVADGRAVQHGAARGTTYSIGTGAQS